MLKMEPSRSVEEQFEEEYVYGDDEKAKQLLEDIDVNYEHGRFLTLAVEGGNIDMLKLLYKLDLYEIS